MKKVFTTLFYIFLVFSTIGCNEDEDKIKISDIIAKLSIDNIIYNQDYGYYAIYLKNDNEFPIILHHYHFNSDKWQKPLDIFGHIIKQESEGNYSYSGNTINWNAFSFKIIKPPKTKITGKTFIAPGDTYEIRVHLTGFHTDTSLRLIVEYFPFVENIKLKIYEKTVEEKFSLKYVIINYNNIKSGWYYFYEINIDDFIEKNKYIDEIWLKTKKYKIIKRPLKDKDLGGRS